MSYPIPNLTPLSQLRAFYCNRIMPQTYDDSLSFQELLYAMLKKMNEVIDKVNSYDELINYVIELLEKLDEHIKEIVTDQLQKWYDDGTLKEILDEICQPYFDEFRKEIEHLQKDFNTFKSYPHSNYLEFQRQFMGWFRRGTNDIESVMARTDLYSVCQAGCYFERGGTKYYAAGLQPRGATQSAHPDDDKIYIFNYSTGAYVNSKVISGAGHCNALYYDSNRDSLFIAVSSYNDGSSACKLIELAFDLTLKNTYSNPAGYNESVISSVCGDGDTLYISMGSATYEFDPDTNTAKNKVTLPTPSGTTFTTQVTKCNKTVFVRLFYNSNALAVYDKAGNFIRIYSIPYYADGSRFYVGECEDITIDDDFNLWMNSMSITSLSAMDSSLYIWTTNILKNAASTLKQSTNPGDAIPQADAIAHIWVDNTSDKSYAYVNQGLNKCDGTRTSPLVQIFDAIMLALSPVYRGCARIHVKYSGNYYRYFSISGGANIEITGRYETSDPPATRPQLQGLVMQNCNTINLDNLYITNSNSNADRSPHTIQATNVGCLICNDIELSNPTSNPRSAYNMLNSVLYLSGDGSDILKNWNNERCIRLQRGSACYGYEKHNINVSLESENGHRTYIKICDSQELTEVGDTLDLKNGSHTVWTTAYLNQLCANARLINVLVSTGTQKQIISFYGYRSDMNFTLPLAVGDKTASLEYDGGTTWKVSAANGLTVCGVSFTS